MTILQVGSIVQESATYDEGVHLASGYRYWKTGSFALNTEHPPLQKLLSAVPLLPLRLPLPSDPKLLLDQTEYAKAFVYQNTLSADTILLLGRIPTILLSILLMVSVAWAARRYFGSAVGLIAVWFSAMDPNLIAHGRYVTTDVASALFYFLAVVLWVDYQRAPGAGRAAKAGLALGLALSAKFSMIILLPLLPALLLLHWLMVRVQWRAAAALALVSILAVTVVLISYGPESWRTLRGRKIGVQPETVAGVTLPAHTYVTGLRTVLEHSKEGHPAFLLGRQSVTGWWYYFPVVFAVKSTTALLAAVLLAAALGLRHLPVAWRKPRESYIWLALLLAPVVYFGVTLTSHINLGVRHLLPIYPFLYVLCAAALVRALPPRLVFWLASALLLVHSAETLAAYPEYLGFFNAPSGGRAAGPRYLLDSNVDWGQDLKKLKAYTDRANTGMICLDYFGSADPSYFHIRYDYLPKTWDKDERDRMDCIGAISLTFLQDVYIRPGSYQWLRERTPIGLVGSSIALFDLRKPAKP